MTRLGPMGVFESGENVCGEKGFEGFGFGEWKWECGCDGRERWVCGEEGRGVAGQSVETPSVRHGYTRSAQF
jgi:hypothetical protein